MRSSRLFLLLESQFQIETLFRNILLALVRRADKEEYYNVAKDVITTAGLADQDLKLRVFNVSPLRDEPEQVGRCRITAYRTNYRSYTIPQPVQTHGYGLIKDEVGRDGPPLKRLKHAADAYMVRVETIDGRQSGTGIDNGMRHQGHHRV